MEVKFLSPAEVEAIYSISAKTLANWRCEHYGPPYHRVGRSIKYSVIELDAWMAEQQIKPVLRGVSI